MFENIIKLSCKSIVVIVPSLNHVAHKHGKSSNTSICTQRCTVTSRSGDTSSMQDKGDVGDKFGGNTKKFGRMGGLFINFCELS